MWLKKTCPFTVCESWVWKLVGVSPLHRVSQWKKEGVRSDRPVVRAELTTKHRAAVARVVYVAQDRLDVEWRHLSSPEPWQFRERVTTIASKRVARYLHGHPDYMQWYPVQEDTETVVLTTDPD